MAITYQTCFKGVSKKGHDNGATIHICN